MQGYHGVLRAAMTAMENTVPFASEPLALPPKTCPGCFYVALNSHVESSFRFLRPKGGGNLGGRSALLEAGPLPEFAAATAGTLVSQPTQLLALNTVSVTLPCAHHPQHPRGVPCIGPGFY